jgi:hypothetical protein
LKFKRASSLSFAALIVGQSLLNQPSSFASAGWYPTFPGDIISMEFCVPKTAASPAFLQLNAGTGKSKIIYKVNFAHLKSSRYCQNWQKDSLKPPSEDLLDLKFDWKVNQKGEFGLDLYVPNIHKTFYGWPDGITSKTNQR